MQARHSQLGDSGREQRRGVARESQRPLLPDAGDRGAHGAAGDTREFEVHERRRVLGRLVGDGRQRKVTLLSVDLEAEPRRDGVPAVGEHAQVEVIERQRRGRTAVILDITVGRALRGPASR